MHLQRVTRVLGVVVVSIWAVRPALAQETGAFTVHLGAASSVSPKGDGVRPSVTGDLSFVAGPFSLGPELGVYFTGADSLSPNTRPESAVTLGGVVRYRFRRGAWSPHGVIGMGAYWWDSVHPAAPTGTYFSGSLGAGVSREVGRRGSRVQAEARLHQLIARTGRQGTRRFVAIGVGFSLGW